MTASTTKQAKLKFIDLFAGIGGIRTAFERAGRKAAKEAGGKEGESLTECVFSCEWNKFAQETYKANFDEQPHGDIHGFTGPDKNDEDVKRLIPDHDILTGGFPCQPFSLAGVSKKNSLGRAHGFDDPTQGTLFFDIKRIIQVKQPKAFFLENVKNLFHHDKGRTWEVIRKTLEDELKYVVSWKIVNAANWVPQHRQRIFIVGYHPNKVKITREGIIIPEKPDLGYNYPRLNSIIQRKADPRYVIGPGTWATLERHKKHHAEAGNGFGYSVHKFPIPPDAVTRTISARYHKDGAEILIETGGDRPRKLSIEEAAQLQGFDPHTFHFPVSDTQAYKQIGNSVAIPAVEASAREIIRALQRNNRKVNGHVVQPILGVNADEVHRDNR